MVMGLEDILVTTRPFELAIGVFFTVDIVLNFFTAYYSDIDLRSKLSEIFIGYLKTYLLFDLACTIPSLITNELAVIYWLKIFRFVRFRRFL